MSDNKIVQPTFPMSEEEHDKYVDLAWSNGKMSIQEQKIRELIKNNLMQYSTGVLAAPTTDVFIQTLGVHFRFSEKVQANLKCIFNMTLGTLYGFSVQAFINDEPDKEMPHLKASEVNDTLEAIQKLITVYHEDNDDCYKCEYCTDGRYEFGTSLFVQDLHFEGIEIADIDVYITDKGTIEMLVSSASDEPIAKKILPAKYCPMCGRKFGGSHDS